jgi:hypothetical protein
MVGSGIRKKPIPDPGSGGQKDTGSRIRNTAITGTVTTNYIKPELDPDQQMVMKFQYPTRSRSAALAYNVYSTL